MRVVVHAELASRAGTGCGPVKGTALLPAGPIQRGWPAAAAGMEQGNVLSQPFLPLSPFCFFPSLHLLFFFVIFLHISSEMPQSSELCGSMMDEVWRQAVCGNGEGPPGAVSQHPGESPVSQMGR